MRTRRIDGRVIEVISNQREGDDKTTERAPEFPHSTLVEGIDTLQRSLGNVDATCQVLGQFCRYFNAGWRISDESLEHLYSSTFNQSLLACVTHTDSAVVKLSLLVLNHVIEQSLEELMILCKCNLLPILLSKISIEQHKDILYAVFRILRYGCTYVDEIVAHVKAYTDRWVGPYFEIANSKDVNMLAVFMSFMPCMVNLYPEKHAFIAENTRELLIRSFDEDETAYEAWDNVHSEILETYFHILALPAMIDGESISTLLSLLAHKSTVTQKRTLTLLIHIFGWIDVATGECYLENVSFKEVYQLLYVALQNGFEARVLGELMLSDDIKIAHKAATLLRLIISVAGVLRDEDQAPLRDVLLKWTSASSQLKEDMLLLIGTLMDVSPSDEIRMMYAVPEILECLEDLLVPSDADPKSKHKCVENSAFLTFLNIQRRLPPDHPYALRIEELINDYLQEYRQLESM